MPTIKVNDINMYYEIHGEGEPLVLIVGLGADISEYVKTISLLAKSYKVVAFDNRGAGRTEKPDSIYTIEMMADDTAELMKKLGIERANIIGHSMGGQIALQVAIRHPGRVNKLIVVSSSARSIRNWIISFFGWMRIIPLFSSKYPQPRFAFLRQHNAVLAGNCFDKLHQLSLPIVIMHGRKDKIVPFAASEAMHRELAHSRLVAFKSGHLFFFFTKERQAFVDAVEKFLG